MAVYIGVDFHARQQTVSYLTTEEGEIRRQQLDHQQPEEVRRFYGDLLGFRGTTLDPKMNYLYVETGPSSSLGFMPPMESGPENWRPPREPAVYFFVVDVDRAHRELTATRSRARTHVR